MKAFLIALQFLSRIHLASQSVWRDEDFGRSVLFFPLLASSSVCFWRRSMGRRLSFSMLLAGRP